MAGVGVLPGKGYGWEGGPCCFRRRTPRPPTTRQRRRWRGRGPREGRWRDAGRGKVFFHNPDFGFRNEYELSSDVRKFFQEGDPALDRMAQDFAARLVAAVTENF